mmetsp:Transcript_9499/g.28323  ORF Transcript_9499/g.28323 Transcript_9499/m.28323 type:complete len:84 (-) Transcript_9499:220-471(-)
MPLRVDGAKQREGAPAGRAPQLGVLVLDAVDDEIENAFVHDPSSKNGARSAAAASKLRKLVRGVLPVTVLCIERLAMVLLVCQ